MLSRIAGRRAAALVALVVGAASLSACGGKSEVLDLTVLPATTPSSTSPSQTGTTPTTATGTTALRRASSTTAADTCPVAANRPVDPTLASGRVAQSASVGVRFSSPDDWPVTDVAVAASEVLSADLLQAMGLAGNATLRPLAARSRANFPGLAVLRLPRPGSLDLAATAMSLRDYYTSRRFVVDDNPLTLCLDGARAIGMVGSNGDVLQASWVAFRGDAMFLVVALALDDGDARSQAASVSSFRRVLSTFRFTG